MFRSRLSSQSGDFSAEDPDSLNVDLINLIGGETAEK